LFFLGKLRTRFQIFDELDGLPLTELPVIGNSGGDKGGLLKGAQSQRNN